MSESNMRAKYESLTSAVLKDLCKARKIKGISRLDKAGLVDAMLKQDEVDSSAKSTETLDDTADEKARALAEKLGYNFVNPVENLRYKEKQVGPQTKNTGYEVDPESGYRYKDIF